VEVVRVGFRGLVVRGADGTERTIPEKQAGCFDVLEARPIEVSGGDRLLLTANRRETKCRITNGELATVSAVGAAGRIQLDDGRSLSVNYRSFDHGYAVTAHRSQGKTVDSVIISGDGMQKELFYVAASRGRQSVMVITSDKELLRTTVARSMVRTSASDLVRGKETVLRRGAHRGLEMAREMVRRTVQLLTSVSKQIVREAAVQPRRERAHERGLDR
jgi:ATP-dependent exoDNAse (exonuclease V) alpha subunit